MQMIEVESGLSSLVANVIERLIIDKQFKNNINYYVVQWIKEILVKINETETQFQKMEIRASTINIPLHRTLAQLIFIFFDCSLDNIQDTTMINSFYTQTGLTQQEFYKFLRKNIIQPLQCFSFTKEIERKLWVHNTEYIKTVSSVYFQARTGFYNQDMLFLQIAILFAHQMENSKNFRQNLENQEQMQVEETKLDSKQIQKIQEENQTKNQQSHFKQEQDDQGDQNKVLNDLYSEMLINFSNKQEWKKIVTDKLDIDSVTDKQYVYDKYEKYLFLITDFFYLTNFLLVDEISSFNVFAHFFREEEDEEIVNKYQSSWKNIAIAYMQQYNFQDLQSIKNQLVKNYLSDKVKIKDEIITLDCFKNIEEFLNFLKNNCENLNPDNLFLQKYLLGQLQSLHKKIYIQKDGQQEQEQQGGDIENLDQLKMIKSQLTVDTEESRKCVICKDDLIENFGYQAYMTKTNLHQYSKYQTFQKIARNQEDKDQEFQQIGIGYDKYNQQITEKQKKEQFESIQHFIANVQNINIVEFESSLETDYEILEIIEGMYKNCINTIDLLDLQYFYKEQMELYRNIYNIYLIFFQNYESKLKGPYLFQKLTYIVNLVNSLNNQSQSKKYTKYSKINTENIIFNDVDQLLINYMTYSGIYFRECGQQINSQMFLCLFFVKLQQMRIAFNDKQELNNQNLYSYFFKEEKYLRVLINMVKKYIAHLLLTQSLKKQGNYKIIVEYEQEFEYLVEEAGFNQQKIIEFFNQNIEMIRSWEINMNLPEAIEQNKGIQKNILDFKEKQKQDLLQFLHNLRKKQSEDNISQKRKKKSSHSSISSQNQKNKQQKQSQQSGQDMEEEEESEEIFESQQQNQQQQQNLQQQNQQHQQQQQQQINQNEGQIQQEQLEEEDWEDEEEEDEEDFEDDDEEEEYFEMEGDSDSEEEDLDLGYLQVDEEGQGQEFFGLGENGQEEGKNQEEREMAEKQKQQEKIQEKQFLEYKQEQEIKKMHKKYLPLLLSVENVDFQLFDIENKFGDLTQIYMNEKCSVCKDFPKYQELCLCLICGSCQCSITCENQFNAKNLGILNKHSIEAHCGSSVFLSLKTGKIYLVKHPMNFLDEYLYYDQYGQSFKKNSKDWNDFYLDTEIFNNLKKMVVKNAISQNICYYQTKYDKYYKNAVF
ncbi:hypothetical protein PPERSA_12974 [Pseudocohnilembus persalinus]|uniref:E3 ubiquitin-protein ligase n=1 Tax=Pseudocohnilembus persalinus TaxID=266149 RepID=A0A0V0R290_PSEPJ|nr:hypothetical protein PPERSA_12974 [Pseudocohnilembus persalinus]|eukprot:KRX08493.1 hypothetical protein PPERSA_12974 [Pseudocohnilembus persalinus]